MVKNSWHYRNIVKVVDFRKYFTEGSNEQSENIDKPYLPYYRNMENSNDVVHLSDLGKKKLKDCFDNELFGTNYAFTDHDLPKIYQMFSEVSEWKNSPANNFIGLDTEEFLNREMIQNSYSDLKKKLEDCFPN